MTSHYKHRRSDIASASVGGLESGEIAVNTANRQIAVGAPGTQPLPLLGVRIFDVRAQYAINEFVVNGGSMYVSRVAVAPGAFDLTKWRLVSNDPADTADLSNYLLKAGGTMTGVLTLYSDTPTGTLEAAPKAYVDARFDAIVIDTSDKVAIAGDTMTGALTLHSDTPLTAREAAPKTYVDTKFASVDLSGKVNKTGDTMSGALTLPATFPTGAAHAVNKSYVDTGPRVVTTILADQALALVHAGAVLWVSAATAVTLTVPTDATLNFPIGTQIDVAQAAVGQVVFNPSSGVTLMSEDARRKTTRQFATATLIKTAVDSWLLTGSLVP